MAAVTRHILGRGGPQRKIYNRHEPERARNQGKYHEAVASTCVNEQITAAPTTITYVCPKLQDQFPCLDKNLTSTRIFFSFSLSLSLSLSASLSPSFSFVLLKRPYTYISINRQMLHFWTSGISRERKLLVRENFIQTIGKLIITRPL